MKPPIVCPQTVAELDRLAGEPNRGVVETLDRSEGDIVVAGAGGKMGFHLASMLRRGLDMLGSPRRVIAVSRFGDSEVRAGFEAAGIEAVSADLTRPDAVAALPPAGAVFYLAGKKFGTADSPEDLHRFNVEMPALVADRYRDSPIVALSTGCVYPFVRPSSGGARETDPTGPVGAYAVSCLEREQAFLEASERHRTPLALIRLNYSVDLRYGVLVDLATKILAGEAIDVTMGWFNCIWQGDAVAHIVRALGQAAPHPRACILNVTGPKTLSVRETAESIGRHLNLVVTFSGTEAPTAWLNDASKAHRLFGPPAVPEDRLVDWVAEWVGHGRPLLGKPTHFEVRDGNY